MAEIENTQAAMTMVLGELFFNYRLMEDEKDKAVERVEFLMSILTDEQRALVEREGGNA